MDLFLLILSVEVSDRPVCPFGGITKNMDGSLGAFCVSTWWDVRSGYLHSVQIG